MRKEKKPDISKLRDAMKVFMKYRFPYRLDRGDFDTVLRSFFDGDSLLIHFTIEFLANDILFMNALAGNEITTSVSEKVYKQWKIEDKKNKNG